MWLFFNIISIFFFFLSFLQLLMYKNMYCQEPNAKATKYFQIEIESVVMDIDLMTV